MKITAYNFTRKVHAGYEEVSFFTADRVVTEEFFSKNPPEILQVEIKKIPKRRSLDANAYFWKLADILASKLNTTAVEIYRELIHRVGVFDYVLVTEKAKDNFIKNWESRGTGWIIEEEPSKIDKTCKLKAYTGSSHYDTKQMARLIDELIMECKEQGIDTLTPNQREEMLQRWGAKNERSHK